MDKAQKLRNELVALMDAYMADSQSFVSKGNKAAARRSRKALMDIQRLGKEWRKLSVELEKGA